VSPRVRPAPGIGRNRPTCTARVRIAKEPTWTRNAREKAAQRHGRPVDVCGRRATHIIDSEPRCLSHAGQDALRILAEEQA